MAKKKILLLSDDLRLTSGIATVSRDLALGSVSKYDWVQIGAAINHPEKGKLLDLSDDAKRHSGVDDASVKIYCNDNYGDPLMLRKIIEIEKPDAILHFTDPRFWGWLYNMENEIRQKIPLMYLNIWDGGGHVGRGKYPVDPMWNADAYASCDLLMAISKQTFGINHRILNRVGEKTTDGRITYVPHGIDTKMFHPIEEGSKFHGNLVNESKSIRGDNPDKFVVFWNNRNIHRKHPADVVIAYREMCEMIDAKGGNAKEDCVLLMHTTPIDHNGTDLTAVVEELCRDYPVLFSDKVLPSEALNVLYNVADVTLNMASNEGFGLSTAESIVAGTPIVVNVTGGLQDQCGFINPKTGEYFTPEDYIEVSSLHDRRKWHSNEKSLLHGEWVKPVWPSNLSIQGSVPTPYIFDDRVDYVEVGEKLYEWYKTPKEIRKKYGLEGRKFALRQDVGMNRDVMCQMLIDSIEGCFKSFKPRTRYTLVGA